MKIDRLFSVAVIAIAIGFIGIAMSSAGMMMDGCMMDRGHMRNMMQRMMPGMLPSGVKLEDLPNSKSNGAKLLNHFCTQCHDLPSPAMHTSGEWAPVANRMFARMSMMGGMMNIENPTAKEQQTILAYLMVHSMKSVSPGALPSPESRGAILFKETCSQCHALPDPNQHTAQEWPNVVERMKNNMQTMGKKVISEQEKKDIVDYIVAIARQ